MRPQTTNALLLKFQLLLFIIPAFINSIAQPPARWQAQIAYDAANDQVLIFGGAGPGDTIFSDTWSLKNGHWKKLSDTGPATIKCAFAYNADSKKLVLFGGSGSKPLMDETWEWDGSKWEQKKIAGPPARNHPMAAYDPVHHVIVLHGGVGEKGLLTDTWVYDGNSWQLKDARGPAGCIPHGVLFDEATGQVLMVTLNARPDSSDTQHLRNDVWTWTGDHWKKWSSATVYTSLQGLQSIAGAGNGNILLFDGDNTTNGTGKTWLFTKGNWKAQAVAGPSARVGASMIYNPKTKRTVLLGGSNRKDFYKDVWEWDGKKWRNVKM